MKHKKFMAVALIQANLAKKCGEVPVGAVVVINGKIVARGFNRTITDNDPTAHAEVIAVRKAAKKVGNYRLNNAIVYVTLEPCAMCAGMLVHARVKSVVYGTSDPKAGACGSVLNITCHAKLNHKIGVIQNVLQPQCAGILKKFFQEKR
ncbi:MAG: tRNA adenosine(34) deaminase TadA [Elusimicrobiota bacterium]